MRDDVIYVIKDYAKYQAAYHNQGLCHKRHNVGKSLYRVYAESVYRLHGVGLDEEHLTKAQRRSWIRQAVKHRKQATEAREQDQHRKQQQHTEHQLLSVEMSEFGRLFRVSTFGESHCAGVGCIIDGVPPRMQLTEADVQVQLDRRRPGQSALTTARDEADAVSILSGTEGGLTLGTPIAMLVRNKDQRPYDYGSMADVPRPSHADFTYQTKYGIRASSGGGRASARETIGRVAAGAVAERWLASRFGTNIVAYTSGVGPVSAPRDIELSPPTRQEVDASTVRCPHAQSAAAMTEQILAAKSDNDSIGGVVTCIITNVPLGLGEPTFDKLEAMLAHAMLSIPATKGFEIGSGFEGTRMRGSQHNDAFAAHTAASPTHSSSDIHSHGNYTGRKFSTTSNHSGGIQGGISNGEPIVFRVAFKPAATIGRAQQTVDFDGSVTTLSAEGRHDPCVVPRAIPIVEAMAALVLADAALIQQSRVGASMNEPIVGKVARQPKPAAP